MLDRGRGGGGGREVTVVLGEMDAAQVNPYRFGRDQRPVQLAWSQRRRLTAVTKARRRLEVCLLPGGRRLPDPDDLGRWGMGDDVRRGQKEGSATQI